LISPTYKFLGVGSWAIVIPQRPDFDESIPIPRLTFFAVDIRHQSRYLLL
jgi:hypothetical protein